MQCAVNPQLLRENQFGSLKQNGMGRRIVVVGAGPAGLQCAVTLAKRRFSVVLLEKEEAVGGALRAAAVPPCKDKISGFIETLRMQAAAHNVRIITGADASPELVESYSPEAIFLAVGGSPLVPPIPGAGEYGQMPQDVLLGKMTLEGEVTVVGSGMTGLETAETLAERGSQITLVEMQDQIGPDMSPVLIADIMTRLGPKNPRILTSCQLTGLREKTVLCKNLQTGKELEIYADHVVLAMGVRPDREYIREFTEYFGAQKVFRIGDCEAPGNIYHAVKSGFLKAAVYQS